jgi:hypothetical protein
MYSTAKGTVFLAQVCIYQRLGGASLDSYNVESENFLLTFFAPSPFPSPCWGEGGGEGKFQIFLARTYAAKKFLSFSGNDLSSLFESW